jgi:hypothetical protein
MDNDLMKICFEYFEQYRAKKNELDTLLETRRKLEADVENLSSQVRCSLTELDHMKTIISAMIDNNIDPVEAKIRIDNLNFNNLWVQNNISYNSPLLTLTTISGSTDMYFKDITDSKIKFP